jgi:hypothetical protein
MKTTTLIIILTFAIFIAAAPGFSQTGNANVGVGTRTETHARTAPQTAAIGSNAGLGTRIESNPELAARVRSMLPSDASINSASAGFKNEGQFLAALHASHNLDIPFDQLKSEMTGSHAMSLGSAIKASKPDMSGNQAKEAAKKAEADAKASASAKAATSAATSTTRPSEQK